MKQLMTLILMTIPGVAFSANNFSCHAFCVQTEQKQSMDNGKIYDLILARGSDEYQASGYSPDEAFAKLVQSCRASGGTKVLKSFQIETVQGPNILKVRGLAEPSEFLHPALTQMVPASIAESCDQIVQRPESRLIDSTGTIRFDNGTAGAK